MTDTLPARCFLTGVHITIGLAAGVSMVTLLLQWTGDLECLPPFVNVFGDPVSMKTVVSGACEVIEYCTGIVCALNLLQALTLNCCWRSLGCVVTHQTLAVLTCLFCGCCGSMLTIIFVLWCHSLQNSLQTTADSILYGSCEQAANWYDNLHSSSNMTAYFRMLEIQQGCNWAITPLAFIAVLVYKFVMCRVLLSERDSQPRPGGRYYLLQSEELSPLLRSEEVSFVRRSGISSVSCVVGDGVRAPPYSEAVLDRPVRSPVTVPTVDRPVRSPVTVPTVDRPVRSPVTVPTVDRPIRNPDTRSTENNVTIDLA